MKHFAEVQNTTGTALSMRVTRWALGVTALALLALMSPAANSDDAAPSSFTVQASIVPESLHSKDYQTRGVFWAETTVTNVSATDQEIVVWTQYGWSWLSNNKAVTPGTEARQNIAARSVLRPGQKYTARLELFANPRFERPLTFRLGFYPTPERPIPDMNSAANQLVCWSNDIVLDE